MRLIILLCSLFAVIWCGPADECFIMQTTDPRTPCYLNVNPQLQPEPVPTFVYAYNLPKATRKMPCPVIQTLDPRAACYLMPKTKDDPAYYLRVPLPPNADEIDESPEGLQKLREERKKPLGLSSFSASSPSVHLEIISTIQDDTDNSFQPPVSLVSTKSSSFNAEPNAHFNRLYGLPNL